MTSVYRRRRYLVICGIVLVLWIMLGHFEAVEAPYVGF